MPRLNSYVVGITSIDTLSIRIYPFSLGRGQEEDHGTQAQELRLGSPSGKVVQTEEITMPRCLGKQPLLHLLPVLGPWDGKETQAFKQEPRGPLQELGAGFDPAGPWGSPQRRLKLCRMT